MSGKTLPKLNDTLWYEDVLPSTGKPIRYRPYLVKEEKILLLALETDDRSRQMRAMLDTVTACVEGEPPSPLASFDVEYLFVRIRSKSVGETAELSMPCSSCGEKTNVSVDLSSTFVDPAPLASPRVVEVSPAVRMELKYPRFLDIIDKANNDLSETEMGFAVMEACLSAVLTEDERISRDDISDAEVTRFFDSMTTQQMKGALDFFSSIPAIRNDVGFSCSKCGTENQRTLRGAADFF